MRLPFPQLLPLAFALALTLPAHAGSLVFQLDTGVPGQKVYLASNLNEWSATDTPLSEIAPGSYETSLDEPWLPEVAYKFVVDGRWIRDPSNPAIEDDGHGGENSVVETSFSEDPLLDANPAFPPFPRADLTLTDREGSPRTVTVVTPPPRFPKSRSVTVYFQDGGDYLDRTGAVHLLENLSREPGFPALTGVFIPPKDRMREYELLDAYSDWVALDVVPAIEARYRSTGGSRMKRLLVGPSLGGLITAYTALRHTDVFGNAASESGSFWWNDGAILPFVRAAAGSGIRLWFDVGTYEDPDMPKWNRAAEDAAIASGLDLAYHEYPSTHDWIAWRNRLQAIFRHFFTSRGQIDRR